MQRRGPAECSRARASHQLIERHRVGDGSHLRSCLIERNITNVWPDRHVRPDRGDDIVDALVALIVTVVDETDFGDLRMYPAGSPAPSSSTINFAVGKVRANNVIIPLGSGGQIAVQCDMTPGSTGQTHFLFDVTGYFQ